MGSQPPSPTYTLAAQYVHGGYIDELLVMRRDVDDNGSLEEYFYHADDQFNIVAVTNASGTVVERYEYGPFGAPTILDPSGAVREESAIGNANLWNGREYDAETGLYYYRLRYLDPELGRFTTLDPIGLWGDPNNLGNGYAYVGNRPWTGLDPFGLDVLEDFAPNVNLNSPGLHASSRLNRRSDLLLRASGDAANRGLDNAMVAQPYIIPVIAGVGGTLEPTPFIDISSATYNYHQGDYIGALGDGISTFPYAGDLIGKGIVKPVGYAAAAAWLFVRKAGDTGGVWKCVDEIASITTSYGTYVRSVDNYKHALEPSHVRAAAREKGGEVIVYRADGVPFDHLTETRNAMRGAKDRIIIIKKHLKDPNLSDVNRAIIEGELGEMSRMLDNAERILGEMPR